MVALDRSFSMSHPGMFERAPRRGARSGRRRAGRTTWWGWWRSTTASRVAAQPGAGRATRQSAAIDRTEPGFGATGIRPRRWKPRQAGVIGAREGRIVVVTDRQQSGWHAGARSTAAGGDRGVDRGSSSRPPATSAVTAFDVTPAGAAAVVVNTGSETRPGRVQLIAGGAVVEAEELPLEPGPNEIVFNAALPPAGLLEIAVDDPGGLPADDRRYHLLGAAAGVEVALVGSAADAFYLERALRAGDGSGRYGVRHLEPAAVTAPALDGVAAVWLLGTTGLDRAARARLAALVAGGGGLLAVAGPRFDPAPAADMLGPDVDIAAAATPPDGASGWSVSDMRHPAFQVFRTDPGGLAQIRFTRIRRVELPHGRVLAVFSDGSPALVELPSDAGRLLLLASDLGNEWNDFPRRPSFVPFVHEATRYLAARSEAPRTRLVGDAPPGVEPLPGAAVEPEAGRTIVLNVDPRESDPARLTAEAFGSRSGRFTAAAATVAARDDAAAREAAQGWWWYAVLAMAVLLVAESWLGRAAA